MAGSIILVFNDDGTVGWKAAGKGGGATGGKRYNWLDEPECPEHGRWEWVPPGTRKDKTKYNGFWTCSDDNCLNRPGREFTDNIDPDEYMAESAGDDTLPFA